MDTTKPVISKIITWETTVESWQLDFYQHVNNAVYLNYLESARVWFLTDSGIDFQSFLNQPAMPVVASVRMDFKKPAYMGDRLRVRTWISHKKRVSVTFSYEILNQAGELIHEADTVLVFVDPATKRAAPVPPDYLKLMNE